MGCLWVGQSNRLAVNAGARSRPEMPFPAIGNAANTHTRTDMNDWRANELMQNKHFYYHSYCSRMPLPAWEEGEEAEPEASLPFRAGVIIIIREQFIWHANAAIAAIAATAAISQQPAASAADEPTTAGANKKGCSKRLPSRTGARSWQLAGVCRPRRKGPARNSIQFADEAVSFSSPGFKICERETRQASRRTDGKMETGLALLCGWRRFARRADASILPPVGRAAGKE